MADDPRRAALLLDMERHSDFGLLQREQITRRAMRVLDDADADPLLALLADEDRVVDLIALIFRQCRDSNGYVSPARVAERLLDALREVAGIDV